MAKGSGGGSGSRGSGGVGGRSARGGVGVSARERREYAKQKFADLEKRHGYIGSASGKPGQHVYTPKPATLPSRGVDRSAGYRKGS